MSYLVCEQQARNRVAISEAHLGVEVVFPLEHRVERLWRVDVKHQKGANRFFVVDPCHVSKPFLAGDVPQLHSYQSVVVPVENFQCKIDANLK